MVEDMDGQTQIQSTGSFRIAGWLLVVAGVLLLAIVGPLFTIGGALDGTGTTEDRLVEFVGAAAPWLGGLALVTGVVLLVIAAKRAAANREAVQRATISREQ